MYAICIVKVYSGLKQISSLNKADGYYTFCSKQSAGGKRGFRNPLSAVHLERTYLAMLVKVTTTTSLKISKCLQGVGYKEFY